jgi:hypothetical protein
MVSTDTAATGRLSAVDGRTAYAATGRDTVLKTMDGGARTRDSRIAQATLRSFSVADASTVFAAGDFGTILRYDAGSSPILPPLQKRRQAPTVGGGRLRFFLDAAGPVSGRFFDIQGRDAGRWEAGYLEAGAHALDLRVPPGGPNLLELRLGVGTAPLRILSRPVPAMP